MNRSFLELVSLYSWLMLLWLQVKVHVQNISKFIKMNTTTSTLIYTMYRTDRSTGFKLIQIKTPLAAKITTDRSTDPKSFKKKVRVL
ncbi:hypothetical protein BCR33DRAFT_433197 [Rhizoclosmatium globosum]|uniref:Uncharacterized protein n=1 Tax=Rhizoclosmatium globosum TaxID=329046 RepID=A0A1Y2BTS3_9FUNG|nr:hypothetical protein BCR33DRAFT_433197 [Rhizoclosmatium globosum]|eukprot:ORY38146.1 hypothetical protein BCR33DRAFT_433197 [Rhizoclosmatium globosum]